MNSAVAEVDEFILRPAQAADIPSLLAIESASFASDCISRRQMRYLLTKAKALSYVLEQRGGDVVAYAILLLPKLPRAARVYSIAVAASFRGRQLAQQLLWQLLRDAQARHYRVVNLEVRAEDDKTQRLYGLLGFAPVTRRAAYYEDGEDAICMQVNLASSQKSLA